MGDGTCRRYNRTCSNSRESRENLGNGIHVGLAAIPLSAQKVALVHMVPIPLWVEHPSHSSSVHLHADYRLRTDMYTKDSTVVLESCYTKDKERMAVLTS
jgi:hypothetical protein